MKSIFRVRVRYVTQLCLPRCSNHPPLPHMLSRQPLSAVVDNTSCHHHSRNSDIENKNPVFPTSKQKRVVFDANGIIVLIFHVC